jgi:adenine C2-methylase RlmN of 23S rRNA A2503 and tRNA A37
VAARKAADGTTKLLLAAQDGSKIETVVMPYGKRVTACLSSQVGCPVGCAFCATGAMGFHRNLTVAEIVDQLRTAMALASEAGQRISNVVYMGMGEPLLNLGAVLDSIRVLTEPSGLGLGHRSLSVSTVGIPAGILRLAREQPQVNLALSLHAADDETRALLIPQTYRRPLSVVLEAAWEHFALTRRKLLIEYVLISGVNDSIEDARRLAALVQGRVVAVNLLVWTWVCPAEVGAGSRLHRDPQSTADSSTGSTAAKISGERAPQGTTPLRRPVRGRPVRGRSADETFTSSALSTAGTIRVFHPSPPAAVAAFRDILRAAHVEAVVRQSKGAGIEAACGQLAARPQSYRPEMD